MNNARHPKKGAYHEDNMEEEQILEYNIACAELIKCMKYKRAFEDEECKPPFTMLKYRYKVDISSYPKPLTSEVTDMVTHANFGKVYLGGYIDVHELKFHNDWNWIIEVLKKIRSFVSEMEFKVRFGKHFILLDQNKLIESINQYLKDNNETE